MGSISKIMEQMEALPPPEAEAADATTVDAVPVETDGTPSAAPEGVAAWSQPTESNFQPSPASPLRAAADPATVAWNPQRVDPSVIAFHNRYASMCEQYRSIRARLVSMNPSNRHQVLVITSSVPEEGKSVTSLNLAITMAEGGEQRVVVCDADFRRSSLARMLGVPTSPGLAEVFLGRATLEEALQPTPFPNLKILPAGEVGDRNYGDLLAAPAVGEVFQALRGAFGVCLVDTPPVTTVSDVCVLAPHCDGALLVIEMGRTPEPAVQLAVRSLQTNTVNIVGCVLSRFRDHRTHYYDRYYGYYSRR